MQLRGYGEYAYNYTYGHYGNFTGLVRADVVPNFRVDGGVQLSTANVYSVTFGGAVLFPVKVGCLSLKNEYLYKAVVRSRTQEVCAMLTLGYGMDYVSTRVGVFARLFASLPYEGNGHLVEPFNFVYEVRANIFKPDHKWNLGASIGNVDDFMWEHPANPRFALFGNCRLTERLRLDAEVGCQPAGIFHIAANFYGALLRVGVCYDF